jgi:hypothetical protein
VTYLFIVTGLEVPGMGRASSLVATLDEAAALAGSSLSADVTDPGCFVSSNGLVRVTPVCVQLLPEALRLVGAA